MAEGKDLTSVLEMANLEIEELKESMAQLEMAREDAGWMSLLHQGENELSRSHLENQARLARVFALSNPLVKNALAVRAAYVFGQGVGTNARGEDVNEVVQEFLDDRTSRDVLFGAQAQNQIENLLGTDGNVFVAMVTDKMSGRVTPRLIPFEEIREIHGSPGDSATVQYYYREWSEYDVESNRHQQYKAFYPELNYDPVVKHKAIRGVEVQWNAPVYHYKVNANKFQEWGVGDAYAALPWARLYKEFLEDWATLMKSLSKIAWQHTRSGPSRNSQRRRREAMSDLTPGSTASMPAGERLEAVPKTGATIDSESGRPIATLVAAAFGLPVTVLMGDPGQVGARATAETLSFPTRLGMEARQEVHLEARRQLLEYVILQSVKAPMGKLKGSVQRLSKNRVTFKLPKQDDATLTITFPPLDEASTRETVAAIAEADSTGKVPPLTTAELLLRALKVRDVDELIFSLKDGDGKWVDPLLDSLQAAGIRASDELRRGGDPTRVI